MMPPGPNNRMEANPDNQAPALGGRSLIAGWGRLLSKPFDQSNLVALFIVLDFVHKGPHQEDAPAAAFFQIGRVRGIRQTIRMKTRTFVGDHKPGLFRGEANFQ
jgi:hypothetical protein